MLRSGYIKEREDESDSSTSDDDELILKEDTGLNVGVDGVDYAIPNVRSTTILGNEVYNHGFEFDVVETLKSFTSSAYPDTQRSPRTSNMTIRFRFCGTRRRPSHR